MAVRRSKASPGRSRAQERRGCVVARAVGRATPGEDGVVAYKARSINRGRKSSARGMAGYTTCQATNELINNKLLMFLVVIPFLSVWQVSADFLEGILLLLMQGPHFQTR